MGENKEALIEVAKIAEQAERYDDMAEAMKQIAESGCTLCSEERNLLSVAYKNLVGARRSAYRVLLSHKLKIEEDDSKNKHDILSVLNEYISTVRDDFSHLCNEILHLLDKHLIKSEDFDQDNLAEVETKVFYLKMKGDYYRYRTEMGIGDERDLFAETSRKAYEEAFELSKNGLKSHNAIRLGLALNYSVLYYEILNLPKEACKLANDAFDAAMADLDSLAEDSYKDSTLIMELLRDNIALWRSEELDPNDVN